MVEILAQRRPLSPSRGFGECEYGIRANRVYRAFACIEGGRILDTKTLIRLAEILDGTLKRLLALLVAIAGERRIVQALRLRMTTTVVETNIHYATTARSWPMACGY